MWIRELKYCFSNQSYLNCPMIGCLKFIIFFWWFSILSSSQKQRSMAKMLEYYFLTFKTFLFSLEEQQLGWSLWSQKSDRFVNRTGHATLNFFYKLSSRNGFNFISIRQFGTSWTSLEAWWFVFINSDTREFCWGVKDVSFGDSKHPIQLK